MPQKLKLNGPATREEIQAARKTCPDPHAQERLLAIQMAQLGHSRIADIAQGLGRGRATIVRWLRKYRQGGLPGLLSRSHSHRKPRLDAQAIEALEKELKKGQWKSAKEIHPWLEQERGISMSRWGVYYWLKKVGASCKKPRRKHRDQDPEEVEQFKQEIVLRLMQLDIPVDKRVRVWIQDEHRYGLISSVRRCWTLKGHRPTVPVQMKYQWGYAYGACEVLLGELEVAYLPSVSLELTQEFLKQLVVTDPGAIHIIFWDQAGFHPKPDAGSLPSQVRLVEFPAYSPELNPIEPLWDRVKEEVSNQVWDTLEAIESGITKVLRRFWESPRRVWSLLGDTWLVQGIWTYLELRQMRL